MMSERKQWRLYNESNLYMSEEDTLLSIRYHRLLIEAEKHILNYVRRNGLDSFKYLFWSFDKLSDVELDRVNTPRDLFHTLEEIGVLSISNTKVLKVLAEDLKLKELEEEVKGYELHSGQRLAITSYMETVLKTNPEVVAVIVFCVLFIVVPNVFLLPLILILVAYLVWSRHSVSLRMCKVTNYMETVLKTNPEVTTVISVIVLSVLFIVVQNVFLLPLILILVAYLVWTRYRSASARG